MLLGRNDERLALDRLLSEARTGHSGVLALVGEPGIGKTALLGYAHERAAGMRVLRARGVESEAAIPFAGLLELLRPVLDGLEHIPAPQASALAGALALAPASGGDRFAIGAATLSLLSASADDEPLLLLVDDAHWLDASSAEALLFAARRLVADPIALVFAVRLGEPSLLDGADLRTLHLAGLGRADAAQLLARADVSGDVVDGLHRATGGNPLALVELAADADHLTAAAAGAGPVAISASIAQAFLHRFGRLPEPNRRMLVLAAASDRGELAVLARAATRLGLGVGDLVVAEEAGLVSIDAGVLEFRHPLARAAVYAEAPAGERREVHAALAAALPEHDVDRRAWHLAAASIGPDDGAAALLEQAGARARDRRAYAVAAAAFDRGAGLAAGEELRGALLYRAADAAWLAGDIRATLARLDEVRATAGDPLSVRVDRLRAQVAMRLGPVMDGYALIVAAAERCADADPELATVMLAEAVLCAFYAGDPASMDVAARRAAELWGPAASRRAEFFVQMASGLRSVVDGRGDEGAAAARRAVEILEASDELRGDPELYPWAVLGPLFLREADAGRVLVQRTLARARAEVAVSVLPRLLQFLARDQATTDGWAAAEASYGEGIRLARETGQRVEEAIGLAGLACLQARQGDEAACLKTAAEAGALCDELGLGLYGVWVLQAFGDLELGLGRAAGAVARHRHYDHVLRERGLHDVDLSPAPELVEAHVRLGEADEARPLMVDYRARAEAKGQPWALARAARCRGLLAQPDEIESCFDEALVLHGRTPDLFETARTHLAYGARLRRARRRVLARDHLRMALHTFERLGARSWADQARAELAATGETARRRDASTLDELTPQELQIARLLAEGRTTREAAAAIFVSPKTVEYHLRHVYDKLGIRSRAELTEVLAER
jgi:DNA-binding CsgD family transcriptional regulator